MVTQKMDKIQKYIKQQNQMLKQRSKKRGKNTDRKYMRTEYRVISRKSKKRLMR